MPNVPANLTLMVSSATVSASWSPSSGATSYTLYRDGSPIYGGAGTGYVDAGANSAAAYAYTVTATGGDGESAQSDPVYTIQVVVPVPADNAGAITAATQALQTAAAAIQTASNASTTANQALQITTAPIPDGVMTADYTLKDDDQRIAHDSSQDHTLTPLDPSQTQFRRFVFSNGPFGGVLTLAGSYITPVPGGGQAIMTSPTLVPGASVDVISRFVVGLGTTPAPSSLQVNGTSPPPDGTTGTWMYDIIARNFGGPSAADFASVQEDIMSFRNTLPSAKNAPVTKTAAYLAAAADDEIRCDTTAGTFPVTLPAAGNPGNLINVKWVAGTAAPTVVGAASTSTTAVVLTDPASIAAFNNVDDANTYKLASVVVTGTGSNAITTYTYDVL